MVDDSTAGGSILVPSSRAGFAEDAMLRYLLLALTLCGACLADDAGAASQVFTGMAPSGAWYQIQIPAGWKSGDALVMYQHGLDFKNASSPPGLGPLSSVMLGEGYAMAASSYRQRGWALFSAIDDNRELLDVFEQIAGT